MEIFIYNQYGERLAILITENIKICWWPTKLEGLKMQSVCVFFYICRKFELLISHGSVATCQRWWGGYCHMGFVANFIRFPAVQKILKSAKIWQSYTQLKGGNFFETRCSSSSSSEVKETPAGTVRLVFRELHHESKKGATLTTAITLLILVRFANFFHCCKEQ